MEGQKGPSGEAEVNTKSEIFEKGTKLCQHYRQTSALLWATVPAGKKLSPESPQDTFPSACGPTVFDNHAVMVMIGGEPHTLGLGVFPCFLCPCSNCERKVRA